MFILRRYTGSGMEMNQTIGADYGISYLECNKEEFLSDWEAYFKEPYDEGKSDERIYAFIHFGGAMQPLYKNQRAFVMTESGKTFANISFK